MLEDTSFGAFINIANRVGHLSFRSMTVAGTSYDDLSDVTSAQDKEGPPSLTQVSIAGRHPADVALLRLCCSSPNLTSLEWRTTMGNTSAVDEAEDSTIVNVFRAHRQSGGQLTWACTGLRRLRVRLVTSELETSQEATDLPFLPSNSNRAVTSSHGVYDYDGQRALMVEIQRLTSLEELSLRPIDRTLSNGLSLKLCGGGSSPEYGLEALQGLGALRLLKLGPRNSEVTSLELEWLLDHLPNLWRIHGAFSPERESVAEREAILTKRARRDQVSQGEGVLVKDEIPISVLAALMSKEETSGRPRPCILRIAVVGGPQYDRLYERLPLFQQETGHKVEIVFQGPHPALNNFLAKTFSGHELSSSPSHTPVPDLSLVSTHIKYAPSQAHFLQELGLDEVSVQEQHTFLPSALEASTVHGRLIQLPRMVDSRVLFYRADVFESLGLELPKTWQDLAVTASRIRKAAIPVPFAESDVHPQKRELTTMQGYVFPGKLSGLFGTFYELAMMEMKDNEALFDKSDQPLFQEGVVVRVLQYLKDLVQTGAVPNDIEAYYFDEVSSLFADGKCAMVADWPSYYGEMKRKLLSSSLMSKEPTGPRIGVMRYPLGSNQKRSAYSGMHSFAIPKSCPHPEASLALLKFLTRDDQQWFEASSSGSFPTKKAVLQQLLQATARSEDVQMREEQGLPMQGQEQLDRDRLNCLCATIESDMAMFPHLEVYPELEDGLFPMIQDAMMGRITVEEAARLMRVEAERIVG
ncbi:hypothetical protein BGZ83_009003 [Gryganskiella cystojenkinii]|nr:hypothetical protein BGZ83_009003 [Gryganskiella cystojenkinii]